MRTLGGVSTILVLALAVQLTVGGVGAGARCLARDVAAEGQHVRRLSTTLARALRGLLDQQAIRDGSGGGRDAVRSAPLLAGMPAGVAEPSGPELADWLLDLPPPAC